MLSRSRSTHLYLGYQVTNTSLIYDPDKMSGFFIVKNSLIYEKSAYSPIFKAF